VRQVTDAKGVQEVRVCVIGNADSGKSTLIGVLTAGKLDNGKVSNLCSCAPSLCWFCDSCIVCVGPCAHQLISSSPRGGERSHELHQPTDTCLRQGGMEFR
jgi:GTPase SAR1 family protein